MNDLTEFLLACIAADRRMAHSWKGAGVGTVRWVAEYSDGGSVSMETTFDPTRVLAELASKRRIVEAHSPHDPQTDLFDGCSVCLTLRDGYKDDWWPDAWPCSTLRLLALPYADHPDYRPEWKP